MELKPIGTIYTPYADDAPFTDFEELSGEFCVEVFNEYADGLYLLEKFRYIYILFHLNRPRHEPRTRVFPPRGNGMEVGLFATRSPNRFNPIGLTLTKIRSIKGNRIYTSGLDIINGSPLLDIKPYILDFDRKDDANMGWIPV